MAAPPSRSVPFLPRETDEAHGRAIRIAVDIVRSEHQAQHPDVEIDPTTIDVEIIVRVRPQQHRG